MHFTYQRMDSQYIKRILYLPAAVAAVDARPKLACSDRRALESLRGVRSEDARNPLARSQLVILVEDSDAGPASNRADLIDPDFEYSLSSRSADVDAISAPWRTKFAICASVHQESSSSAFKLC